MLTALVLAALGGAAGLWTWLWLVRHFGGDRLCAEPPRAGLSAVRRGGEV
jgi:hypothetical protein